MSIYRLDRAQLVRAPLPDVFAFFSAARNLEAITPPWLQFEVLTPEPVAMRPGARIAYRLRLHGVPMRWMSEIELWEQDSRFVDRQVRGPYRLWRHTHQFTPDRDGTLVSDHVLYALPLGAVGELAHAALVRRDLNRIFDYRAEAIASLLSGSAF